MTPRHFPPAIIIQVWMCPAGEKMGRVPRDLGTWGLGDGPTFTWPPVQSNNRVAHLLLSRRVGNVCLSGLGCLLACY